jgi:non-canonical purine NTP pyrophosphatase (RdgB/HAM1 family)
VQSLNLKEVVTHKAQQAYKAAQKPVLVDDVSLECVALHGLPGPLIKWFIKSDVGLLCQILNSFEDRSAIVTVLLGLCDGQQTYYFEGVVPGKIAAAPKGNGGFGWDKIFIPEAYDKTRAEMDEEEYQATSPRAKAIKDLKRFLQDEKA